MSTSFNIMGGQNYVRTSFLLPNISLTVKKKKKKYSVFHSVFLLNCYCVCNLQWIAAIFCFFTFIFVKYCVFYSVKCKMLRYIVKISWNIVIFFNRQIRAIVLPTKYCKFCIFYSKPVIFLQKTVLFLHKNCKTNKKQVLVKIFTIYF